MNTIFTLTSIFFFIWLIRNVLFWVGLWQTKEYRLDRMLAHLSGTEQGRNLFFSVESLCKWILIFLYGLVVYLSLLVSFYTLLISITYLYFTSKTIREFFSHALKRPQITIKSLLISILSLVILIGLYKIPLTDKFLWFVVIDRISFIVVAFLVFIFSFPSELYRDFTIKRAIKKIREHKRVLVIGVTGSYGKSSTKEFITQIMSKKFKTISTKGTNNTPIGVACTILNLLKKDTQIFVVEMGAYKKGEISQICQIVSPKIGLLTGINEQHLSLFGSIINTMDTKYELIESLPKNGLALFNANNEYSYKLSDRVTDESKIKKVLYGFSEELSSVKIYKKNISSIVASSINAGKTFVTFDVSIHSFSPNYKKRITNIRLPVVGVHALENLLGGIFIADYLGINAKEIKNAISTLSAPQQKMVVKKDTNGIIYIDDTYNSNPAGVQAVVDYIKHYKADVYYKLTKKVFILQPLIELGKVSSEVHYRIASEIGKVCDILLLTNKNFYNSIVRGIEDSGGRCAVAIISPNSIPSFINKNLNKDDMIIFEGREAGIALHYFLKQKK